MNTFYENNLEGVKYIYYVTGAPCAIVRAAPTPEAKDLPRAKPAPIVILGPAMYERSTRKKRVSNRKIPEHSGKFSYQL